LPPKLFSVLLERTRHRPADFKARSHGQKNAERGYPLSKNSLRRLPSMWRGGRRAATARRVRRSCYVAAFT
jgi:hypothetical protein